MGLRWGCSALGRALLEGGGFELRVLMLVPSPGIDGPLPKLVPLLVESLRRRDCEVDTACWSRHAEDESLPAKLAGRTSDLLTVCRRLATRRYDVLFVHTAHTWAGLARDVPLVLLSRWLCDRRVVQFHGSSPDRLLGPGSLLFKAVSRALISQVDAVLVLSEEERREWSTFFPHGRFEVVTNPFLPVAAHPEQGASGPSRRPSETSPDLSRPGDHEPVLLFVGRLMREKGVFDLVEALRELRLEVACRLVVAGDGPAAPEMRGRVARLGLTSVVTFCGYLGGDDLQRAYRQADVFVLPTYYAEGFPTVIVEAMGAGLPIVTTLLRGALDHLDEGVNALFVEPRRPDLLADALRRLLADDDLRVAMGRRNASKVEEFAPDTVSERYVSILQSVVGLGRDRSRRSDGPSS